MKSLVLLVLCAVAGPATAQTGAASQPVLETTGAFFALSVPDIQASTQWYKEKLGLEVVMRIPKENHTAISVLEGGGLIVELIERDGAQALSKAVPSAKERIYIHGLFKAGVIVENYEKALAMLKERQVEVAFGPFPAKGGQRANVIIRDNAGNLIQIFGKR